MGRRETPPLGRRDGPILSANHKWFLGWELRSLRIRTTFYSNKLASDHDWRLTLRMRRGGEQP
jgi:hypothetical protein